MPGTCPTLSHYPWYDHSQSFLGDVQFMMLLMQDNFYYNSCMFVLLLLLLLLTISQCSSLRQIV
jgi:hypothetical protein